MAYLAFPVTHIMRDSVRPFPRLVTIETTVAADAADAADAAFSFHCTSNCVSVVTPWSLARGDCHIAAAVLL